ncbi:MAG TPA: sigma-70 family RNA polymerase sigma factor [Candidatus Paceibacterota bacterium]
MEEKIRLHQTSARDGNDIYAERVRKIKFLTANEERRLGERILTGDSAAQQELVLAYTRLAQSEARKVWSKYGKGKVQLEDLIQGANMGLVRAAQSFDYRKARFATCALPWIKEFLMKSFSGSGVVRIPDKVQKDIVRITRASKFLAEKLKRSPTTEELMSETGLSKGGVENALYALQFRVFSLDQLAVTSTDDTTDAPVGDFVPDRRTLTAEQILIAREELAEAKKRVQEIFKKAEGGGTPRHFEVFKEAYGSPEHPRERNETEVAHTVGLTRQRIHQILGSVWKRLGYEGPLDVGKVPLSQECARIEELEALLEAVE